MIWVSRLLEWLGERLSLRERRQEPPDSPSPFPDSPPPKPPVPDGPRKTSSHEPPESVTPAEEPGPRNDSPQESEAAASGADEDGKDRESSGRDGQRAPAQATQRSELESSDPTDTVQDDRSDVTGPEGPADGPSLPRRDVSPVTPNGADSAGAKPEPDSDTPNSEPFRSTPPESDAVEPSAAPDPRRTAPSKLDGAEPRSSAVPLQRTAKRPTPHRPSEGGPRQRGEPWRVGARRGKGDASDQGTRQAGGFRPPELLCRQEGGEWQIVLTVDSDLGVKEVHQGDEVLKERDGEYRLTRFSGALSLRGDEGELQPLGLPDGKSPLIFRLSGAGDTKSGRQCRRITMGHFLVIAPCGSPIGYRPTREDEDCTDADFRAHHVFASAGDTSEDLGSIGSYRLGADRTAALDGTRIFDSSEDGELFVGDPPRLVSTDGIEWARVGEERRGGWIGQNFLPNEESLARVIGNRRGRFFLRTYEPDSTRLVDGTAFRYWPDLRGIEVDGQNFEPDSVLVPGSGGHKPTTVRLVGRNGPLTPELRTKEHARLDGASAVVGTRPDADDVQLEFRDRQGSGEQMNVVVHLPRIWWRLAEKGDWGDKPLRVRRAEFRREGAELQILVPPATTEPQVGFERDYRRFPASWNAVFPNKRCAVVPLEAFADHDALGKATHKECPLRARVGDTELDVLVVTPDPRPRARPETRRVDRFPVPPVPAAINTARRTQAERTGDPDLKDQVVSISRVTKVVKGGKNLSFSALVVVGNEDGRVGFGLGKAREVPAAIKKGIEIAKKNLTPIPREGTTIAHEVVGVFGAGRVLLKPASKGTGVIAGGPVRAVVELAGIKDILTKSIGTKNPKNVVEATMAGLLSLRSRHDVAELRGRRVTELDLE